MLCQSKIVKFFLNEWNFFYSEMWPFSIAVLFQISEILASTIPQPTRLRNTQITCSDYESDGYKCVPNIDCEGTFSVRSEALDYYDYEDSNPTCSDPSQTCCHQDRIKKVCKTKEFQCLNGDCIPAAYVCDTDEDCQDGSDEIDCQSGEKL